MEQDTHAGDTPEEPLEFGFTLTPNPDQAVGQYVLEFEGRALAWDDNSGEERVVGEIRGLRIDLASAHYDGVDQRDLLDSLSQEVSAFSAAVLQEDPCRLPESGTGRGDQRECACLVYISEVRVDPGFRGRGTGTDLMRRMSSMIDLTDCLVALKAFPLADDHAERQSEADVERVKRFYSRLGFIPRAGEFMVKDGRLCDALRKRLAGRRGV